MAISVGIQHAVGTVSKECTTLSDFAIAILWTCGPLVLAHHYASRSIAGKRSTRSRLAWIVGLGAIATLDALFALPRGSPFDLLLWPVAVAVLVHRAHGLHRTASAANQLVFVLSLLSVAWYARSSMTALRHASVTSAFGFLSVGFRLGSFPIAVLSITGLCSAVSLADTRTSSAGYGLAAVGTWAAVQLTRSLMLCSSSARCTDTTVAMFIGGWWAASMLALLCGGLCAIRDRSTVARRWAAASILMPLFAPWACGAALAAFLPGRDIGVVHAFSPLPPASDSVDVATPVHLAGDWFSVATIAPALRHPIAPRGWPGRVDLVPLGLAETQCRLPPVSADVQVRAVANMCLAISCTRCGLEIQ